MILVDIVFHLGGQIPQNGSNRGVNRHFPATLAKHYKNSSGDEIANVNFLTTISHTRRPTSKYRKKRQTYFV